MLAFDHYTFRLATDPTLCMERAPATLTRFRRACPCRPPLQTWAFWRAPHAYLDLCRKCYGSLFTINAFGKPPMIFMSQPAEIASIISAPADVLHAGAGASVIRPLVGEHSFMLLEEPAHMTVRKAIMPAYHSAVIAEHAAMVKDIAERESPTGPSTNRFPHTPGCAR